MLPIQAFRGVSTHPERPNPAYVAGSNGGELMAAGAWRVCTSSDCPELHQGTGRCPACRTEAEAKRRPGGSVYGTTGHRRFRQAVLDADPICVLCHLAVSNVADHHPLERKELELRGLDPNDPQYGRGLCKPCHDRHTAETNPAGWNQRP